VVDVSDFALVHPGGAVILRPYLNGKRDATDAFQGRTTKPRPQGHGEAGDSSASNSSSSSRTHTPERSPVLPAQMRQRKPHPFGDGGAMLPETGDDAHATHPDNPKSTEQRSPLRHAHSENAWSLVERLTVGWMAAPLVRPLAAEGNLVDFGRAVLPQVMRMEPSKYQLWLRTHSATPNMRLFETDALEALSRYPWWYIFFMWIPVICYCLFVALSGQTGLPLTAVLFAGGLLYWMALEYGIHRFMFHVHTSSPAGNFYHFFAHGIHHLTPFDSSRLTFPPLFSAIAGLAFWLGFRSLFGSHPAWKAFYAGGVFGFMMYDTMHFYFHHDGWPARVPIFGPYFTHQKRRHMVHHFQENAANFGVTSPLFDWLFGTMHETLS
jgi:sterol desaturase/sphingolipid hydroxylase (fatty acid hydroxylase superfamily)